MFSIMGYSRQVAAKKVCLYRPRAWPASHTANIFQVWAQSEDIYQENIRQEKCEIP